METIFQGGSFDLPLSYFTNKRKPLKEPILPLIALEAGPNFRLKFGGNKKPLASNNLRYKEFLYWIVYRAERI